MRFEVADAWPRSGPPLELGGSRVNVDTASSSIRQRGRSSSLVTNRLLETIALIAGRLPDDAPTED